MNHFNSQLRYMSEEEQVGAMRTWFFKYYEDPANETPYEGEYIYIQGGPYDAETELRENFEGIASENAIITLTEELAELGSEWAPTHRHPDNADEDIITWEETNPPRSTVLKQIEGQGKSGEQYIVWYGPTFLSRNRNAQLRWIAYGWPEPDSDSLPHFDSQEEAIQICEKWEAIKIEAEISAREEFTGIRTGQY